MRGLGPRLREHRIGRANLAAAFPEKSPSEIEGILRGVWDNLGRVAAEFAHIDRLRILEPPKEPVGDIIYTPATEEGFHRLRRDGQPALIFAAHLANWELPALIATRFDLDTTVLYRALNISAASDAIIQNSQRQHGQAGAHGSRRTVQARAHSRGRRACRHARRPALRERRRRDVLRPPVQGQSAHRAPCCATSSARFMERASCACPIATASVPSCPNRSRRDGMRKAESMCEAPCRPSPR